MNDTRPEDMVEGYAKPCPLCGAPTKHVRHEIPPHPVILPDGDLLVGWACVRCPWEKTVDAEGRAIERSVLVGGFRGHEKKREEPPAFKNRHVYGEHPFGDWRTFRPGREGEPGQKDSPIVKTAIRATAQGVGFSMGLVFAIFLCACAPFVLLARWIRRKR